jgi:hypothetical protein
MNVRRVRSNVMEIPLERPGCLGDIVSVTGDRHEVCERDRSRNTVAYSRPQTTGSVAYLPVMI